MQGDGHPGWPARLGGLTVPAGTVTLRSPRLWDGPDWSRIRLAERDHLQAWEPSSPEGWEQRNALFSWPGQWAGMRRLARHGTALPFVILVDGVFAGQVTVGNIVRGALCSGWIGYWVSRRLTRGGVASAAVALAVDHCFGAAGLHRLEATVRPDNEASLRVLEKTGFRREGLFRRYLYVAEMWRDHVCLAITAEDVADGAATALVRAGRADWE
ncbi:GNAT family N-acetyltransferase [Actinoalloteichus fjordicus]|uniref:Acetyltransferase, ribosomal protein N-acetylase n=1 Tax=Actinoalloteichus fjordicus TaxID=1612552 RepID=A0AAC9PQ59_9PSEU|nr:GNAT family protein [Actinoalloteichus fjordicus]APU12739.1 acetyltransferase, ribosomal protein N-acetylase [Actinoalloteichus fjordicus]